MYLVQLPLWGAIILGGFALIGVIAFGKAICNFTIKK